MTRIIKIKDRIKGVNDKIAAENRKTLKTAGIKTINMMSSPGAGKTTIVEETIRRLAHKIKIGIIEGDIATDKDAERVQNAGASQVVQINTEGACHLDADMVRQAMSELRLEELSLLIIENVGNLVCPTGFDLGEEFRVMIASITEGEDKPKKYPGMYLAAETLVLNKIDLAPYVNVDITSFITEAKEVNPRLRIFKVSATTGEGMDEWVEWVYGLTTADLEFIC